MGRLFHKVEKFWEFGGGRMVMAAFCAHSVGISIGITQGYSAIWLPQLKNSSDFNITEDQSSWLASLGAITNPIGSILSGILAEVLGRKRSIQISSLPFIVGWILIAFGRNIDWLYCGRLVTGIAGGMSTASFTYVGEIATPNSRGFLQTLSPIFASFGILLTYILGYLISWNIIALISITFAIFTVFTMQFLPDSPPYLMKFNDKESLNPKSDVFKAYMFFSRNVAEVEQEIQRVADNATDKDNESTHQSLKQLYLSSGTIKPFLILVFLFLLQELSGIYTILYYAVQFIGETHLKLNDYVASIMVGTVRFVMSLVCAMLIQKVGRKTLCTFSSCGMALSVLALGLYVKYYEIYPDKTRILTLLPLVCIMLNVFFSMTGMLPIPWVLVGEMFPLRVRPIMAGIVICMAQCFIFVCVKMYNTMVDYLGFSGTIFSFFAASTLAMLYSKYILPETRGKTLDEIEDLFKKKQKSRKSRTSGGLTNEGFSSSSENVTVISVVTR